MISTETYFLRDYLNIRTNVDIKINTIFNDYGKNNKSFIPIVCDLKYS